MQHKNPTLEQLGFFAVEREKAFAVEATKRMKAGKGADDSGGRGKKKNPVAPMQQGNGRAVELAAKEVGIGSRTISSCKAIAEKGCPQLIQATKANRVSISLRCSTRIPRLCS